MGFGPFEIASLLSFVRRAEEKKQSVFLLSLMTR
jgi:hypothetical protein